MPLFQRISNNVAAKIAKVLHSSKDEEAVLAYGAYLLLDTILALFMVMLGGALFGVFWESLVFSFTSAILRKSSGGAHASTPFRCATIGAIAAVGFSLIIKYINPALDIYSVIYMIIALTISLFIIYKLAPVDSPNKPIVKEEKIKELKRKSLSIALLYALLCVVLILLNHRANGGLLQYVLLICTGTLWQAFSLTSLGHKLGSLLEVPLKLLKNKPIFL